MKNNAASAQVKPKLGLGNFDYARTAREMGGLVPREDIGEILSATKNNPQLIDYLLRSLVRNPRRIAVSYHGTYCRLLDYHLSPEREDLPVYVSRVSGAVLSESWGEHCTGGLPNGIFDVAQITQELERKDFPKIYRIVRERYEAFKRLPPPTEASNRENALLMVRYTKELLLPYLRPFFSESIRKAPTSRRLWKALPLDVQEEEFGGSPFTFLRFLEHLAREDRSGEFFRVDEHRYANNSRFRLTPV